MGRNERQRRENELASKLRATKNSYDFFEYRILKTARYETVSYYLFRLIGNTGQVSIFETNEKKVVDDEEENYLQIQDSRVDSDALGVAEGRITLIFA
ncbi:hypothetical protein WN51_10779 [Melipona quadrifasciata]|uniref:Uncharacterized protein n=1 Tax=Melipona quadrifasciata TaxID=166423 RepID=A0A0M9A6H6_9HYME|nr:hypothetical protein WN51_10779 [Melipona quadrifasciata]